MSQFAAEKHAGPYKVLQAVQMRVARIEVWENNIIYFDLKDNDEVELADAKEHTALLKGIYDGKNKFLVLVNPGQYTSITKEAREFSATPEANEMTIAVAVIIKSLAQRMIMNFISVFTKTQAIEFKSFEDRETALEWLISKRKD